MTRTDALIWLWLAVILIALLPYAVVEIGYRVLTTRKRKMMPTPWTPEKRSQVKRKIDKEAARVAARIGAKTVAIIAFFPDGEYLHMQDGGTAPMDFGEMYRKLASVEAILRESGGADVFSQLEEKKS